MVEHYDNMQTETAILKFLDKHILKEYRRKNRRRLYIDLIVTAIVIYLLFQVIFGVAVIQKDSMRPNLTNGSVTVFLRLGCDYKRNDIVIFRSFYGNELLIKRIVAVAGDRVDIDNKTGKFMVNGTAQESDFIIGKTYTRETGVSFPMTVPNGCVFVLGDNREVSLDSRDFGFVDVSKIIGKLLLEIRNVSCDS